jgi:hypothetical protein
MVVKFEKLVQQVVDVGGTLLGARRLERPIAR